METMERRQNNAQKSSPASIGLMLLCAVLLFSREPGHLLRPGLWAEDGPRWLRQAYELGFPCLWIPSSGYLQILSRLVALLAVQFPLTLAPFLFASVAFLVQLLPAVLLLSSRGAKLVPSLLLRGLIAVYYVGAPNSSEVYVALTNAMWHLSLAAFLIIALPKPLTWWGRVSDVLILLSAGLSGPMTLFLVPIAWWHWFAQRNDEGAKVNVYYALALTLCAIIQVAVLITHMAGSRLGDLGATPALFAHILVNQLFAGGIIGARFVRQYVTGPFSLAPTGPEWWADSRYAVLFCFLGLGVWAAAFLKGPTVYRQYAVFSALIMASALASPLVSLHGPQWPPMIFPGIGGRYFMLPILAWFVAFLVLASGRQWWAWLARGVVLCFAVGVFGDWYYTPYVPTDYNQQAEAFERASPGTKFVFSENPFPWHFSLTKH
jgi:hypothetical protein